jgi:predicted PhzF superfamily epimerase YddE/YHI9
MATEANVLRVFTDAHGKFGNLLGVISAGAVPATDRQRVAAEFGYSDTIFLDDPTPGFGSVRAEIFTPALDLLLAGHPAVGAAWWPRERGKPIRSLQFRAGVVEIRYVGDLVTAEVFAEWTPEFTLHELSSPRDVIDVGPDDHVDGLSHYLWAWIDKWAGHIRSRALAPELGLGEDEATGAGAIRITEHLGRDLIITQGKGSVIYTFSSTRGWVAIGGRVLHEGRTRIT